MKTNYLKEDNFHLSSLEEKRISLSFNNLEITRVSQGSAHKCSETYYDEQKQIAMDFWDIAYTFIIPALAGGILGPIYARWFRWWRRSRKQKRTIR